MRSDLMLNYFKSFKTYDLSFSLSLLPLANEHLTTKFMCVCVFYCASKNLLGKILCFYIIIKD
jgi:hypothetical protein